MPDYKVNITTPADLSGFAQLDKAVKGNVSAVDQLKVSSDASFRAMLSAVDGAIAAGRGKTAGLKADMQATADATAAMGGGANKAATGFANFGMRGNLALAGVAAGATLVSKVMAKIADDSGAEVAFKKLGVSASEAANSAKLINNLELFTGSRTEAAEMFGRAINGNYAALRKYGIELGETATKQDAMNAMNELAARGLEKQAAELGTFSGQIKDIAGTLVKGTASLGKWAGESLGLGRAMRWVTQAMGSGKTAAELQIKALNARLPALIAARQAEADAAAAADLQAKAEQRLAAAMEDFSNAAHRAAAAQEKLNTARAEAARAAAIEDAKGGTKDAAQIAQIEAASREGKITPADAARRITNVRAMSELDAAKAADKRAIDENLRLRTAFDAAEKESGAVLEARNKMPEGPERDAATAQLDALSDTIRSLDKAIKDALANSVVTAEGVKQKEIALEGVRDQIRADITAEKIAASDAAKKAKIEDEIAKTKAQIDSTKAAIDRVKGQPSPGAEPGAEIEPGPRGGRRRIGGPARQATPPSGLSTGGLRTGSIQEDNARLARAAGVVPRLGDAVGKLTNVLAQLQSKVAGLEAQINSMQERATGSK